VKILLDECVPKRLAKEFPFPVSTVQQLKLSGLDNGKLLKAIEDQFDVLVTVDQNLPFQQNIQKLDIAVVVIRAPSNRYNDILPIIHECIDLIPDITSGEVVYIPAMQ
jgi:hypothetical protein